MQNLTQNQILESSLDWRYAVKKYDPSLKISDADWKTLSQAILKSPSSMGLTNWKALVINDPVLRAKLADESFTNKNSVLDASHFVVFATKQALDQSDVDRHVQRIVEVRNVTRESLKAFEDKLTTTIVKGIRPEEVLHWTQRHAYIAMGFLLEAAAILKVDATPMEGINGARFDRILGLEGTGYKSVFAVTLGYRHADDAFQNLAKVRFAEEDVIKYL